MNKDGSKPDNIKCTTTIPEKKNTGVVDKIISFNDRNNKYLVLFKVPNGKLYKDLIPPNYLRGNLPQVMSDIEKKISNIK